MTYRQIIFIVTVFFTLVSIVAAQSRTVINGQQVRDRFAAQIGSARSSTELSIPVIAEKTQDLVEFAEFLTIADARIEQIALDEKISLTHQENAKLLGLIPVTYRLTLMADPVDLSLQMETPRLLWLAASRVSDIRLRSEEALRAIGQNQGNNNDERVRLLLRQKIILALLTPWRAIADDAD